MISLSKLIKEPRVLFALVLVLLAIIAIGPVPQMADDGTMTFSTNIAQGIDMEGGARALVLLKDADDVIAQKAQTVLEMRVDAYGLKEKQLRTVKVGDDYYIQLEMAGANEEELKELIERQGKFEASISRNITYDNATGEGVFIFAGNEHDIDVIDDDNIEVDGTQYSVNDTFEIEGITAKYNGVNTDGAEIQFFVIFGEDIKHVFTDTQHSRLTGSGTSWNFQFSITLSREAADRFALVTDDLEKEFENSRSYLSSNIDLYLDDGLVDSLRISSDLKGKATTDILISGSGESKDDALKNMISLQSILQSGALPTEIEIVQMNSISPSLGAQFMRTAIVAILFSIIAVSLVVFARYKDARIVIPIVLTSCIEVLLIFGVAALINWTIDLAAIAGIIAAIGSGVDDQIIITDESGKKDKEELSMKRKLKRAFFIIFASAATTIAVMVPLAFVGAGVVRGFAFTTSIGVLIGVFVTRPAFAKVVEHIRR